MAIQAIPPLIRSYILNGVRPGQNHVGLNPLKMVIQEVLAQIIWVLHFSDQVRQFGHLVHSFDLVLPLFDQRNDFLLDEAHL